MLWTVLTLIACWALTSANPEIAQPGPDSGIALKEQPGLLITNCRLHTQKVFVELNPEDVYRRHLTATAHMTSWAGVDWSRRIISHAADDTAHMLRQLQKFTVTQSELNGINKRPKRFIGGLLTAASLVGSLFGIGLSSVNAVSLSTVKRHVGELEAELPDIRTQLFAQRGQLQTIGQTLKGTVLLVNSHSETLNKTLKAIDSLLSVVQVDVAHTQVMSMLTEDMLREIGSSIDSLAAGRIPPYLVPLSLVQNLLATATRDLVTPVQAHLAYTLGSAIPIYVNPDRLQMAFLVNLPIVSAQNVYRLKNVINVGFWKDDTHIKIQTPSVVAYHDDNPDLYLAPNLRMCTLTKDIHYLCPSKPFIRDGTNGICGLKPMMQGNQCPVIIKPRSQIIDTQAEIAGGRWLVNTPATTALLTYDQHDTSTRINLPAQTLWVDVPKNAILHIEDLALYHLESDQYESQLEISDFFKTHVLELDPTTIQQVQYEGTQTVDVTPIDNVLKEIALQTQTPRHPFLYTWSTPDTLLVTIVILGYLLTFGIAFFYLKRTQALQAQLTKCNIGLARLARRKKGHADISQEPEAGGDEENHTIDPLELITLE